MQDLFIPMHNYIYEKTNHMYTHRYGHICAYMHTHTPINIYMDGWICTINKNKRIHT